MRINEIITELRKISNSNKHEDKKFILTDNGYIILFKDGDDIELPEEIDTDDINDLIYDISIWVDLPYDDQIKYLVGMIKNNVAEIYYTDYSQYTDTPLNKNIKKMVKELGLSGVKFYDMDDEDEYQEFVDAEKLLKTKLSNIDVYHGTSSESIFDIIKFGLKPNQKTNFNKVLHSDKIFFTTKFPLSKFHSRNSSQKTQSVPVVIKFKIPDTTKIVLDYDTAIEKYGVNHPLTKKLGYDLIYKNSGGKYGHETKYDSKDVPKMLADKNSLNTKLGIFGYTGRISSSQIEGIYTDIDMIINDDFDISKFSPSWFTIQEFIEKVEQK